MKFIITKLLTKNLKEAHKIYNYYIINSYSNFEEKKVSFKNFMLNYKKITQNKLPFIVALIDEKVVGIAYLNKFREKSGYKFAFENTIYVDNKYINQGIGYKLLKKLISVSKKNKNIKKIVAVIAGIDSNSSVKIHQKSGFKKSGLLKKIGFKNGKWIDSIIMQKDL
ncbi:GNAT family N-acetyltransferase [Pelagibacteraceae bacterium]|nr:GNAT family N-acetyltransferase [Pelagibacteraceae bacterium]